MNSTDLHKFSELMGVCWATLGNGKVLNPALIGIYFNALDRFDISEVKKAFNRSMVSLKWFPKPVELIEFITGSDQCNGDVQATNVLKAISQVGGYESVNFNDPVTHAVIDRFYGGWVKLCQELLEKDNKWFLKDFASQYKSFKSKGIEQHGHLGGRIESNNSEIGIKHDNIKQIGDILKKIEFKSNGGTNNDNE